MGLNKNASIPASKVDKNDNMRLAFIDFILSSSTQRPPSLGKLVYKLERHSGHVSTIRHFSQALEGLRPQVTIHFKPTAKPLHSLADTLVVQ